MILVISTQYPSYGGAATNAYALIQYLRSNNHPTFGVFIEQNNKIDVDPDKIGNVIRLDYYPFKYNHPFQIMGYRKMLNNLMKMEPLVILCKNYFTPICAKQLYPAVPNIFLISGLDNIVERCGGMTINHIYNNNIKIPVNSNELKALNNTTLAVANSNLTLKIFSNCYSDFSKKIHSEPIDTTQYLVNIASEKIEKKYDIIIASSILTRPEKNNIFLVNLLKNSIFDKYTKLVVGDDNAMLLNIPNVTILSLQPHAKLINLMKQSRILLYPSLYDSNPNTVREAVQCGCLVLISDNIGYYEKFPDSSVCHTYDKNEWIQKIIYLIDNYDELISDYHIDFSGNCGILQLVQKFI